MALIRVAQYSSTPTVVEDYQAQNAHLQAFTNQLLTQQFILDSGTDQPVIKQGCYVSHGGSLYIADADTPITDSPADGSVYIRVSGTTSLTVEFINYIYGYAWNPAYSALTSGSYTLLPYLIVKAGTVWTRYNFNPNGQAFGSLASLVVNGNATVGGTLAVTGAISGDTINTGFGNNEVYSNSYTTYIEGTLSSSFTRTLPSMQIGEIKFIHITFMVTIPGTYTLKLPSGGTYLVHLLRISSTSNYTYEGTALGIVKALSGGEEVYTSSDVSFNVLNGYVRRLS